MDSKLKYGPGDAEKYRPYLTILRIEWKDTLGEVGAGEGDTVTTVAHYIENTDQSICLAHSRYDGGVAGTVIIGFNSIDLMEEV